MRCATSWIRASPGRSFDTCDGLGHCPPCGGRGRVTGPAAPGETRMHVGVFLEERRRGVSEATAFQETLELADAAEAWGLDTVWLGEIHFNPARSVQSA